MVRRALALPADTESAGVRLRTLDGGRTGAQLARTLAGDSPRLGPHPLSTRVERRHIFGAEIAAKEMAFLSLRDALGLLALYASEDSPKYGKAATDGSAARARVRRPLPGRRPARDVRAPGVSASSRLGAEGSARPEPLGDTALAVPRGRGVRAKLAVSTERTDQVQVVPV